MRRIHWNIFFSTDRFIICYLKNYNIALTIVKANFSPVFKNIFTTFSSLKHFVCHIILLFVIVLFVLVQTSTTWSSLSTMITPRAPRTMCIASVEPAVLIRLALLTHSLLRRTAGRQRISSTYSKRPSKSSILSSTKWWKCGAAEEVNSPQTVVVIFCLIKIFWWRIQFFNIINQCKAAVSTRNH